MNETETPVTIDNRADFTLWAIERAKEIVSQQGTDLALAACDGNEEGIRTAGNALGSAITKPCLKSSTASLGRVTGMHSDKRG